MTIRKEIVVLLCFVIFASCQVILPEKCETYFLKDYCATITQINCTTIEGQFKLDGKVISTQTYDITNIIGKGGLLLYTYPASLGGVSGSWSIGSVTTDHATFWFTEVRGNIRNQRDPTEVTRECGEFCPNDCSDRGDCVEGACECIPGYIGYACNILVDDNCFADATDPKNTFCVGPSRIENCTRLIVPIRLGSSNYEWEVNIRNPLTKEMTDRYQISNNNCQIFLEIFAIDIESDGIVKGIITAQSSCIGNQIYPVHPFHLSRPIYCETTEMCTYSSQDDRILPEPTNVRLDYDAEVYYVMEQHSENPIVDLSFIPHVKSGAIEASFNPLCRPTEANAQGVATLDSNTKEWVIIPKNECSDRILSPTHAMYYYFRFQCASQEGCEFSLEVIFHNVVNLVVKSEAAATPTYMPIFWKPFYQYFQVAIPRDSFQLQLMLNYNDRSNVFGSLYALPGLCASKENHALSTTNRVSSNHTDDGRLIDTYILDVPLDSSLDIEPGKYLEITLNFTTVNGDFPLGYYSLVAVYPTDVPSLPSVTEPTPDTNVDPVTGNTPDVPPESTDDQTGGSKTSDDEDPGNNDSDDGDSDEDSDGSSNAGLWIGLTIGAFVLVGIVAAGLAGGYVFYRRSKKSRYPLSIDDDGLLLSDEGGVDFDL